MLTLDTLMRYPPITCHVCRDRPKSSLLTGRCLLLKFESVLLLLLLLLCCSAALLMSARAPRAGAAPESNISKRRQKET